VSVSTNEFKNGMTLELDGTLFQIVEFQHVKPGKGGAFVRSKLRNVKTGAVLERTFNAGVKVGLAIVERKDMQYLFADAGDYVFMDMQTYEQLHVPAGIVGEAGRYLVEGGSAQVSTHEGVPIGVELPASMVLRVTKTDPGVKGDTRTGALKAATVETGIVVQVPLFVEEGEKIKVDTRSGAYVERVK
jgi:elongation factor P